MLVTWCDFLSADELIYLSFSLTLTANSWWRPDSEVGGVMVVEGVNYECADFLELSTTCWRITGRLVITNKLVQNTDVIFITVIMQVLQLIWNSRKRNCFLFAWNTAGISYFDMHCVFVFSMLFLFICIKN